jgi:aminomethyltransferase
MDESTTPLESALAWVVKWQPEDRDFIGMGALLSQKQQGLKRKFVGLTLEEKGIMRPGQRVIIDGYPEGVITSGTYSPTLGKSIAFARVPVEAGAEVMVDIRGKMFPASVGKPRFVKDGEAI